MSSRKSGSTGASGKRQKSKYKPAHGRDFEIMLRAQDDYETSRTRDRIAYLTLGAVLMAMILAATYGFYHGNLGVVKDVWTVVGPITGGIVGYYFHRGRKDSG